jgi:hypothetical protein
MKKAKSLKNGNTSRRKFLNRAASGTALIAMGPGINYSSALVENMEMN